MKQYKKMLVSTTLILGMVVMGSLSSAFAVPMLKLTSGASSVTITDGGAGDTNASAGTVGINQPVGDFIVNITTGTTKPALGSSTMPQLDLLNLISLNNATPGSLVFEFTDTGFTAPGAPGYTLAIGGTTNSQVTSVKAYRDASDTAFGHAELIASLGSLGSGPFSDSITGPVTPMSGPYSVTLEVVIDHQGSFQQTAFNATLLPNPEPGTMVLFGTGLIGLFGYGWRRKQLA